MSDGIDSFRVECHVRNRTCAPTVYLADLFYQASAIQDISHLTPLLEKAAAETPGT